MSFFIRPCRHLDHAACVRIAIDDAGGFECVDDAESAIEPAGVVLAVEMRSGQ